MAGHENYGATNSVKERKIEMNVIKTSNISSICKRVGTAIGGKSVMVPVFNTDKEKEIAPQIVQLLKDMTIQEAKNLLCEIIEALPLTVTL